jgi:hypothetical protein
VAILEQTAAIYRALFAPLFGEGCLLEHHSLAGVRSEGESDAE